MSDDDPHADRIPSPSSIESGPATSLDYVDFELESKIGTVGSADVWRTRLADDEQVIAVKRTQPDRTLSTDQAERVPLPFVGRASDRSICPPVSGSVVGWRVRRCWHRTPPTV